MNLYLYFPHLLTEFGKIWYKPSAHSALEHWWVSWKSAKRILYFVMGINKICSCTVKIHGILRLKNATSQSTSFTGLLQLHWKPNTTDEGYGNYIKYCICIYLTGEWSLTSYLVGTYLLGKYLVEASSSFFFLRTNSW